MVLRNVELGRSRTQYQLPLSSYTYKYKYIYIYIRDPAPFPSGSWLGFASSPGCPEQPTPQSIRKKKELAIKLAASPEHQIINIAESEWEEEDGGTCACIPASPPVMRWIKMMMEPCRERVREMGNDVSRRQKPSVYIYIFFLRGVGVCVSHYVSWTESDPFAADARNGLVLDGRDGLNGIGNVFIYQIRFGRTVIVRDLVAADGGWGVRHGRICVDGGGRRWAVIVGQPVEIAAKLMRSLSTVVAVVDPRGPAWRCPILRWMIWRG